MNRITTSSFKITVVSDCTITSLTSKLITSMTYGVTAIATTQNVFIKDAISTGHLNDLYCGPRTYILFPVLAFMSISSDVLSISTNDPIYIGPYDVTITVTISQFPAIPAFTQTFHVDIICGVQVVTFAAPLIPALTTVQVGIDSQPVVVPFATTQFPNCGNQVTFSISPSSDPFMSVQTLAIRDGQWTVNGAVIAQHNTYSYTLTALVDGVTATYDFDVFIKDPCSTSVFELAPSPLADMTMTLFYMTTETQTQSVKIFTDVERAHPGSICPITATLSPALPYITLAADYASINVDGSQAHDPDNGPHTMTLTVNNALFPTLVAQAVYTFVLDLKACVVNDFVFAQQITSFSYMLTDPLVTTSAFLATQSNLNCLFPITYAASFQKDGLAIPPPTAITYNPATRNFSVFTWSKLDPGVFTMTVTASIPQILLPGGILTISLNFDVTIISDCTIATINNRVVNDMLTQIFTHGTQDVTFLTDRGVMHSDNSHCGAYLNVLSPVYPFLSVTGSDPFALDLYTEDLAVAGSWPVTLTVSLPDFP